jgi:hypothetical protein
MLSSELSSYFWSTVNIFGGILRNAIATLSLYITNEMEIPTSVFNIVVIISSKSLVKSNVVVQRN